MLYKDYKLDRFQEEAIASIDAHHTVIVSAPTGAGKTLIAEYAVEKCINEGKRLIYTAPVKVLSNQKCDFAELAKHTDASEGDLGRSEQSPAMIRHVKN